LQQREPIQPLGCENRTKSEDSGFNLMEVRICLSENGDWTPAVKNAGPKMSQGQSDSFRYVEGFPSPARINDGVPHGFTVLWETIAVTETGVATQSALSMRIAKI
jgi:hypothetical protein